MPKNVNAGNPEPSSGQHVRPPNPPWIPLVPGTKKAALSFYYSDPLSKTPIRCLSNKNDPKADPNLETMTFGLFSTCDRGMRATIVRQGIQYQFFCTARRGANGPVRVLTGYYRYGWYFKGPLAGKKGTNRVLDDYMLAADKVRFVSPGFPLSDLTGYLWGDRLDKRFRTFKYVKEETADRLLHLLNLTPDFTDEYLSETCRVEELVKQRDNALYRKRQRGFTWNDAAEVMGLCVE